ncbi:DUF7269 family protein [Haloarcula marina]|uniref:DUF7269 family protein n=1 Tax=Haloarcula marina TaxID=2961574 RepID=UPI0020B7BF15|nr:hypothetical protein [Halomicroarcula marina]
MSRTAQRDRSAETEDETEGATRADTQRSRVGMQSSDSEITARTRIDGTTDADDPGRRWIPFAVVGVVSLAAAVVVATVPGLLGALGGAGATATLRVAAAALAAVAGLGGAYGVARRAGRSEADETEFGGPTGATGPTDGEDESALVGAEFDRLLTAIDGRVDPHHGVQLSYAADVRRHLRATVEHSLVRATGCSAADAERAVETGTWTDDRRAAQFVGGDEVPALPLPMRLRDWASGEGFDRKVRATISEIRRLREGESA